MKRQQPLRGGRPSIWGAIDPALRRWAVRQAKIDDCSISLVVNSSMSYASGIPLVGGSRRKQRFRLVGTR